MYADEYAGEDDSWEIESEDEWDVDDPDFDWNDIDWDEVIDEYGEDWDVFEWFSELS